MAKRGAFEITEKDFRNPDMKNVLVRLGYDPEVLDILISRAQRTEPEPTPEEYEQQKERQRQRRKEWLEKNPWAALRSHEKMNPFS
jgi:hypothetical protein